NDGLVYEDSWLASELASYLLVAGYKDVQERSYHIVRTYPLSREFRCYLQGIAECFVCEGAPLLAGEDITSWLHCFLHESENVLDQESFVSEETEFIVSGVWNRRPSASVRFFDMQVAVQA